MVQLVGLWVLPWDMLRLRRTNESLLALVMGVSRLVINVVGNQSCDVFIRNSCANADARTVCLRLIHVLYLLVSPSGLSSTLLLLSELPTNQNGALLSYK